MDLKASKAFGQEFLERYREDDIGSMAAELAYRFLFAIFPFGIFLVGLGAFIAVWIGISNPADQIISGLGDNLPPDLAASIRPELERVIGQSRAGALSLGALLALWSATSGTMTVMKAMNRAYDLKESRPALRRYALGIGLTLAGSAGLLLAFVTIVGGSLLTEQIASQLGVGAVAWTVISLLRWPLVFLLLVAGVSVLYRFGANFKPSWRSAAIGATVFSAGWLLATFAFGLYVANVANYGVTYGALAGVIVLMLWLYYTAFVLMCGVEIVGVLTHRTEPARLEARRNAVAAQLAASAGKGPIAKIRALLERATHSRPPRRVPHL
jgi:membrane protein